MSYTEMVERWARVALTQGWVKQWVEGAIYPREMVAFLAMCELLKVGRVIESGRQDGFSTMALGAYGDEMDIPIISIDIEDDQKRAQAARDHLAEFKSLRLIKGDAHELVGKVLYEDLDVRTALLMDGPKGNSALSLVLAAASRPNTVLVAIHDAAMEKPEADPELRKGLSLSRYEDLIVDEGQGWRKLSRAEIAFGEKVGAARPLDSSHLGMADLTSQEFDLTLFRARRFWLFQPSIVRRLWDFRMFASVRMLVSTSLAISRRVRR